MLSEETHRWKRKENSDIVLVPQPTDDPNDPLKWPAWKKTVAMLSILWFSGMGGWIVAGVGPALVIIGNEFENDEERMEEKLSPPIDKAQPTH